MHVPSVVSGRPLRKTLCGKRNLMPLLSILDLAFVPEGATSAGGVREHDGARDCGLMANAVLQRFCEPAAGSVSFDGEGFIERPHLANAISAVMAPPIDQEPLGNSKHWQRWEGVSLEVSRGQLGNNAGFAVALTSRSKHLGILLYVGKDP